VEKKLDFEKRLTASNSIKPLFLQFQVWETTIHKSAASGSYGGIIMAILSGGKEGTTSVEKTVRQGLTLNFSCGLVR